MAPMAADLRTAGSSVFGSKAEENFIWSLNGQGIESKMAQAIYWTEKRCPLFLIGAHI
jgi:hypothetical protein